MLSPQSRSLRDPSGCGGYASSQRGMTFKCLLPAYQSEPLSWLCGWAPLSAQRNEHLELDSLMHLYWPHQQDDSKRSGPTICTTWAGAPGRKELPWAKQQEAEAARVQNKKKQVTSGKGICNESSRELKQTVSSLHSPDVGGPHLSRRATHVHLFSFILYLPSHHLLLFLLWTLLSGHLAEGLQPSMETRIGAAWHGN